MGETNLHVHHSIHSVMIIIILDMQLECNNIIFLIDHQSPISFMKAILIHSNIPYK